MRQVPRQTVRSVDEWQPRLQATRQAIADLTKQTSEAPEAIGELIAYASEWAGLASLTENAQRSVCAAFKLGSSAAAVAFVSIAHQDGSIEVILAGEAIGTPCVGLTSVTHPATWLNGFSMAAITRDATALAILCREETLRLSLRSAYQVDKFWLGLLGLMGTLGRGEDEAAKAWLEKSLTLLDEPLIDPSDRATIELTIQPLFELVQPLLEHDEMAWNERVFDALRRHATYWETPENSYDPSGFLALNVLGLCALANERGLATDVESPYLPRFLITATCGTDHSDVVYRFPQKSTRNVEEAHLFMDLQRCAGSDRTHRLDTEGEKLLAHYECELEPRAERLAFSFELPDFDDAQAADQPSTLIDAGQYLWLADQVSHRIPASVDGLSAEQRQQRDTLLQRAIAYLQEVLKFFSPGEDHLSDGAFWSELGRDQFEAEPERFQRGRLEAVLGAWQQMLSPEQAPVGEETHASEAEARAQTLLSLETIKAQVRPLLVTLPTMSVKGLAQALRPQRADYALAFEGVDLAWLQGEYDRLWTGGIDLNVDADQSAIDIHAAPAGMLAYENELSFHFPGGYRGCADLLNPHRIWVAWRYRRPDASAGMAFDGLVWLDDHWVWFPKPFRFLNRWRAEQDEAGE